MKQLSGILFSFLIGLGGISYLALHNAPAAKLLSAQLASNFSQVQNKKASAAPKNIGADGQKRSSVPLPQGGSLVLLGLGFVVYQVKRRQKRNVSWEVRPHGELSETIGK